MKHPVAVGLACLVVLGAGGSWALGARGHGAQRDGRGRQARLRGGPHQGCAGTSEAKSDFTGEACAEMVLKQLGKKWDQDDVFNAAGVDPALARGCITKELGTALGQIGFKVGSVFGKAAAAQAGEEMEAQWRALHADLAVGIPSIVCMRLRRRRQEPGDVPPGHRLRPGRPTR